MSKPISYYLSSDPPFPLESIEQRSYGAQVSTAQDLLALATSKSLHSEQETFALSNLSIVFNAPHKLIDDIPTTEKIKLAAAILMFACDQACENGEMLVS